MSEQWFERDPLWFKRAVFYEVYVRGFFDGNGDGNGDLRGLIEKLDYLQELGVDCLWLMPDLRVAPEGRRLRHRRLSPRSIRRSAPSTTSRVPDAGRPRAACASSPTSSSTTRRIRHPWFQEARRDPLARSATTTSGATPTSTTRRRASSSAIPSRPTGPGTRRAASTTGIASSAISPTSTTTIPTSRTRNARRHGVSGSTAASTASASTPCPTSIEREGTNCENLPETHDFLKDIAPIRRPRTTPGRSCWPRPTSGPTTCSPTSATATSSTWPSTSR